MARIPGVPTRSAGLLGRIAYRYARRRFGAVPEPLTVLMHHPALTAASAVGGAYGRACHAPPPAEPA